MSWPDSIISEIPTAVASELLAYLDDAPTSSAMEAWMETIRVDVDTAKAQVALFPKDDGYGITVDDDWQRVK